MTWLSKKMTAVAVALILGAAILPLCANAQTAQTTNAPSAKANDEDQDAGLHFAFTPYIWFAGMHGTVGLDGHEASVHSSFGDIANYLNFGAMGSFEARYNRVIIPVDFIWLKISDEKGLPQTDDYDSVKTTLRESIFTPKVGYRVVDGKKVKVDALFGLRYWHMNNELTGVVGGNKVASISDSANWVDAVAGGRIILAVSPKAFIVVGGDAGGGSARSDYQVGGGLGFNLSRKWVLMGGYRYLSVNYRPNSSRQFVDDVVMPGLILGVTYKFK
jgi:opacity protein-like surface antigen